MNIPRPAVTEHIKPGHRFLIQNTKVLAQFVEKKDQGGRFTEADHRSKGTRDTTCLESTSHWCHVYNMTRTKTKCWEQVQEIETKALTLSINVKKDIVDGKYINMNIQDIDILVKLQ